MLFKSVFITSVTVPGTVQDTESTEIYKVLSQSRVDIGLYMEKQTNKTNYKNNKKYVKANKEEEEIDKKEKQEKKEKAITVK